MLWVFLDYFRSRPILFIGLIYLDLHWCRDCRKNFTVKMGTIMHPSKLEIRTWIVAIYLVMTARKGISSLQLSKELKQKFKFTKKVK